MTHSQKILLIEDSAEFQNLIREVLAHYSMTCASSAEEGWEELQKTSYDLILLDLGLPKKSGQTLLSEIQNHPELHRVPVVCVTGNSGLSDKVAAFTLGAEDYIQKPFEILELRARVDGKLGRARRQKEQSRILRVANIQIDLDAHQVFISDGPRTEEPELTQTEFKLLHLFARDPGKTFSRSKILSLVWGENVAVGDRVIDVHLCSLRKKIKGAQIEIKPITGQGYKLTLIRNPSQMKDAPSAALEA